MKDLNFEEYNFNEIIENTEKSLMRISPYNIIKDFHDKFNIKYYKLIFILIIFTLIFFNI
jgi:hypothetical protein